MERSGLKTRIARRVAQELKDGDVVNLGIGLPTQVADQVPEGVEIILQSENGLLGMGEAPTEENIDYNVQNAGAQFVTTKPGAMFFDAAVSFGIIRGGHVDVTVLGTLQVDKLGNIANWVIPDGKIAGMGGAMDLSVGAKKVIVATLHANGDEPKIVETCTLPLTAEKAADLIVTEMGVFKVKEDGLELIEHFEDYPVDTIRTFTGCDFSVSKELRTLPV